jgi:glucose-1-phosphate cytidylyltransferase
MPKAMMPINGRPIIVHLMEIYAQQGFTEFVLAAGHRQEILRDYFAGRFQHWNVQVVDTGETSDTGERLLRCKEHVGDEFFATYGDGLGDVDLHELLVFHRRSGAVATMTSVPLRSQYGTVITNEAGRIMDFNEKPVIQDCWINAGFFAINKRIFDHWEGTNLESDVFPRLAEQGLIYAHRHDGFWKSCDTSKDQQEFERIYQSGNVPWLEIRRSVFAAA